MFDVKALKKQTMKQIKATTNPHLKKTKYASKEQEETAKNNEEKSKSDISIIQTTPTSKENIAKKLIKGGYINSFVDFFYLGWKKIPNMKTKFQIEDEKEEDENNEENGEDEEQKMDGEVDELIPRHAYDLSTLESFSQVLQAAEDSIMCYYHTKNFDYNEQAIKYYTDISHATITDKGTPLEAIYFNEKCISIAQQYNLIKPLINSLIDMGNCFAKNPAGNDMNVSKSLNERAKEIFAQNLLGQDYELENYIYGKLISLYKQLASDQEQMKQYDKAIDLLYKLLDVLECLMKITQSSNEKNDNKDNEDIKTETYLNIANLYYKKQDYDNTIKTLDKIPELKDIGDKGLNVR